VNISKEPVGSPAFWAMIVIPTAAVIASFVTLGLAMRGADAELPKVYATEGSALDADFALLGAAKRLGIGASFDIDESGAIRVQLEAPTMPKRPDRLSLTLTHVIDARRDQKITLLESDKSGLYTGRINTDLTGRWLIQLDHEAAWRLRGRIEVPVRSLRLGD